MKVLSLFKLEKAVSRACCERRAELYDRGRCGLGLSRNGVMREVKDGLKREEDEVARLLFSNADDSLGSSPSLFVISEYELMPTISKAENLFFSTF